MQKQYSILRVHQNCISFHIISVNCSLKIDTSETQNRVSKMMSLASGFTVYISSAPFLPTNIQYIEISFLAKRPLMVKFSKLCSESLHDDTN